jgi:hypothetical protein
MVSDSLGCAILARQVLIPWRTPKLELAMQLTALSRLTPTTEDGFPSDPQRHGIGDVGDDFSCLLQGVLGLPDEDGSVPESRLRDLVSALSGTSEADGTSMPQFDSDDLGLLVEHPGVAVVQLDGTQLERLAARLGQWLQDLEGEEGEEGKAVGTTGLRRVLEFVLDRLEQLGTTPEASTPEHALALDVQPEPETGPRPQVEEATRDAPRPAAELLASLASLLAGTRSNADDGGKDLPPAAREADGAVETTAGMTDRPWQDVARRMMPDGLDSVAMQSPSRFKTAQGGVESRPGGPVPAKGAMESVLRAAALEQGLSPEAASDCAPFDGGRLSPTVDRLQEVLGMRHMVPGSPLPTASSTLAQATALRGGVTPPQAPAPILEPPGNGAWTQALGDRVLWMIGRDIQSAELRINPPQLGPVEVRIAVQNDQASVSFTAQHPFTREALEAAVPRLRELMGSSDLNLVNVDVGQDNDSGATNHRRGRGDDGPGTSGMFSADTDDLVFPDEPPVRRTVSGLVDDFA